MTSKYFAITRQAEANAIKHLLLTFGFCLRSVCQTLFNQSACSNFQLQVKTKMGYILNKSEESKMFKTMIITKIFIIYVAFFNSKAILF